ncbi:MAG: hypothetical protein AAF581_05060 [Planctomycetota bacterium]
MSSRQNERVPISRKVSVINGLSTGLTFLLNISFFLWLNRYLLDRVPVDQYQYLSILQSLTLLVPVVSMIFTSSLGRYVVEAYSRDDQQRVTAIASTMFPVLIGVGGLVLAIGLVAAWQVDGFLKLTAESKSLVQKMLCILVAGVSFRLATAVFAVGFFVRQRFVVHSVIGLLKEIIRCTLLLVLLTSVSTSVLWVIVATVTAEFLMRLTEIVCTRLLVPALGFRFSAIDWRIVPELLSFGAWNLVRRIGGSARQALTPTLLTNFGSPLDVVSYSLGSFVDNRMQTLLQSILYPLMPPLVAMHAQGQQDRLRAAYLNGGRYSLWLATFVAAPLLVYRWEVVTLYLGHLDVDIEMIVAVLSVTMLLMTLRSALGMLGRLAAVQGRLKTIALRSLAVNVAAFGVTIYCVCFLEMGARGAVTGMIPVLILNPLLMLPMGNAVAATPFAVWLSKTLVPGVLPALVAAAVWWGLREWIVPDTWLALIGCVVAGAVVFVGTVYTAAMQAQERRDLRVLVAKVLGTKMRGSARG